MATPQPTVYVVGDDAEVRRALAQPLQGFRCELCEPGSAAQFLALHDLEGTGCIVLDIAIPRLADLELQENLILSGCRRPIIFLSSDGDVSRGVRAMRAGAVNFLKKPVDEKEFAVAVQEALRIDAERRAECSLRRDFEQRLGTLTLRERQVLDGVIAGCLNKQIAADLGIVVKTVKVHRARLMRKLGARSVVELMWLVTSTGVVSHR